MTALPSRRLIDGRFGSTFELATDISLGAIGRIQLIEIFRILAIDGEVVVFVADLVLHRCDKQRLHKLVIEIPEADRRVFVAVELVLFEERNELC